MEHISLKARAKINITLDVLGKRDDGYHELEMIMQSVNLCDNIFIKKDIHSPQINLSCEGRRLPEDERNLMYRAAKLIKEKYDINEGIAMKLKKNIPVAAGLAGGSSDCAAVLYGLNILFELNIPFEEMLDMGKSLGADVPYCLMRGTVLASGIGEKLRRLPPFPNCFVLLAKPPVGVSTAGVFADLSLEETIPHPDNKRVTELIKEGKLQDICQNMQNSLEAVTIKKHPIINDIKKEMLENGALGSMMSGSGPTVFGIYKDYPTGLASLKKIRKKFGFKEIYLTTVYNVRANHSEL